VQAYETAVSYDLPDVMILSDGCESLLSQIRASNNGILQPAVQYSQWERHNITVRDVPVQGPDGIQVMLLTLR
jgi:hypothetical protein